MQQTHPAMCLIVAKQSVVYVDYFIDYLFLLTLIDQFSPRPGHGEQRIE